MKKHYIYFPIILSFLALPIQGMNHNLQQQVDQYYGNEDEIGLSQLDYYYSTKTMLLKEIHKKQISLDKCEFEKWLNNEIKKEANSHQEICLNSCEIFSEYLAQSPLPENASVEMRLYRLSSHLNLGNIFGFKIYIKEYAKQNFEKTIIYAIKLCQDTSIDIKIRRSCARKMGRIFTQVPILTGLNTQRTQLFANLCFTHGYPDQKPNVFEDPRHPKLLEILKRQQRQLNNKMKENEL